MKIKKMIKAIMMILLALVVLLCGGFGYLYFNGLSGMSKDSEPEEGQIKVACVGDSITYGHGISNWPKNNYPARLADLLGEDYHVQSFGVSGRAVQDTSDQPYRALEHYQKSLDYEADILVFMMGTNDSKPENWFGEDAFRTALEELLDSYLAQENPPRIYLCTPAKAYFAEGFTENLTKYDIQPEIVEIIDGIVREVAQVRGYDLIDIHALTEANPQWFEKDGVHPNNEGAAAIAQAVKAALQEENEAK
jgi:lysophospholipase L1-like esterase